MMNIVVVLPPDGAIYLFAALAAALRYMIFASNPLLGAMSSNGDHSLFNALTGISTTGFATKVAKCPAQSAARPAVVALAYALL